MVKYGPPFSLGRFFRLLSKSGDSKIELSLPKQLDAATGNRARLFSAEFLRSVAPRPRDVRQPDQHAAPRRRRSTFISRSIARSWRARNGAASLGERQLGFPEAIAAVTPRRLVCSQCRWPPPRSRMRFFRPVTFSSPAAFRIRSFLVLTALLQLRGFNVASLGGFSRLGFGRIVSTAAVLLFAAYPLLFVADGISRWLLGEGSSRQQIVEMFTGSETLQQRILIIVLAIAIAPLAEEFVFRFFLYGVLKRYLGRGPGRS